MSRKALIASAALVAFAALLASPASAQIRDIQDRPLTADDGTVFVVTSGIVRVPEERAGRAAAVGTIDLAVVRVRRGVTPSRTAHVVIAGGPGDSGINLVLGMARQGGAALADLIAGDYIGIDQRGTGQSSPNLASNVLYDLPLDAAGSPDGWQASMERAVRTVATGFSAEETMERAARTVAAGFSAEGSASGPTTLARAQTTWMTCAGRSATSASRSGDAVTDRISRSPRCAVIPMRSSGWC